MKIKDIMTNLTSGDLDKLNEQLLYLRDNLSVIIENEEIREKIIDLVNKGSNLITRKILEEILTESAICLTSFTYIYRELVSDRLNLESEIQTLMKHYELLIGSNNKERITRSLESVICNISSNAEQIFTESANFEEIIELEKWGFVEKVIPTYPFYILSLMQANNDEIIDSLRKIIDSAIKVDEERELIYQDRIYDDFDQIFIAIVYLLSKSNKTKESISILELLARIESDYSNYIARTAVWALGEIKATEVIPLFVEYRYGLYKNREIYFDEDVELRDLAEKALSKINNKEEEFNHLLICLRMEKELQLYDKIEWLSRINSNDLKKLEILLEKENYPNTIVNISIALKTKKYSLDKFEQKIREALKGLDYRELDTDEAIQFLFT